MFNIQHVIDRTCKFEGFRKKPYQDTLGVWTIGYGTTVLNNEQVTADTPQMSHEVAVVFLKAGVLVAIHDCQTLYGKSFSLMSDTEQEVMIHMSYQLGINKLSKFIKMNKAIKVFDYTNWTIEMEDSAWRKQTPRVSTALIYAINNDSWSDAWDMS